MSSNRILIAVVALLCVLAVAYAFWDRFPVPADQVPAASVPAITNPFGEVTAKTGDKLTVVTGVEKKTFLVYTDSKTQYLSGTTTRSAADITVGSIISVSSGSTDAEGSLHASVIQLIPPHPAAYPPEPST